MEVAAEGDTAAALRAHVGKEPSADATVANALACAHLPTAHRVWVDIVPCSPSGVPSFGESFGSGANLSCPAKLHHSSHAQAAPQSAIMLSWA